MMAGIEAILPWIVASGIGGWFGNALLQWFRSREERHNANRQADVKLEEHRDGLTFQLLEAARVELAELRNEVHRLRPMEAHLLHFEEALRHLEDLLAAETAEEKEMARRNARAFLNRVQRLREAAGTLRNEVQVHASTINVVEDQLRGKEPGADRPRLRPPGDGGQDD